MTTDDIFPDAPPARRVRPAPGCPGIQVAHLAEAPKPYIYVGREMGKHTPASPLGNPYKGEGAIERFKAWLWAALKAYAQNDPRITLPQAEAVAELYRLADLYRETQRLTLACWCAPAPCHSDVIAKAALWLVTSEPVILHIPGLGTAAAFYDAEHHGDLPWQVQRKGKVVRFAATLEHARAPYRKAPASYVFRPGEIAAMGMGKCDSCGEVKPGIRHKEICAECQGIQPQQRSAAA